MKKKFLVRGFLTGSILFILLVIFLYNKYVVQPDISLNQIEVQDLDGQKVELTRYICKPLVVNYWATWCAPCIKEFPHFEETKKELADKVRFVMISDETVDTITEFKNSKEYSFEFLQANEKLAKYGINIIPTTYFYNSSGILVDKYTSNLTLKKLKELIDELK